MSVCHLFQPPWSMRPEYYVVKHPLYSNSGITLMQWKLCDSKSNNWKGLWDDQTWRWSQEDQFTRVTKCSVLCEKWINVNKMFKLVETLGATQHCAQTKKVIPPQGVFHFQVRCKTWIGHGLTWISTWLEKFVDSQLQQWAYEMRCGKQQWFTLG